MKKAYKVFSTFDSAKDFAKSHYPNLISRHQDSDMWLVFYEQPEKKPANQTPIPNNTNSKNLNFSTSDTKPDTQKKDDGKTYYNAARSMQKEMYKNPDIEFEDVVKQYIKAANLGNNKALEWLEGQFGTPVKENKIWNKNKIYWPEQVNVRGGDPALVHSVNKKSRRGQ